MLQTLTVFKHTEFALKSVHVLAFDTVFLSFEKYINVNTQCEHTNQRSS